MADANELVRLFKKTALEAIEAGKPTDVRIGTVAAINPIKIALDQQLILESDQLILTSAVRDHSENVSISWRTSSESGGSDAASFASHAHSLIGDFEVKLNRALKEGESVLLLQKKGGQKYIVLDRVVI